jgi:mono/diheme cytochrome c family protein
MRRNKLLLLLSSLVTLALLVFAAAQENFGKEWRRLQKRAQANTNGELEIQLRQVVVPALRVTDRCVSCHVGMAPGESGIAGDRVLGPHPKMPHEATQFGCTVCHGGQGRATDLEDAHGTAEFWPKPMIPMPYAEAGCGACHTHLTVPNYEMLRRGSQLVERYDCLACHRLDKRGGTLRPSGGGMEGPDISQVGARGYRADWYAHHSAKRDAGEKPWAQTFGEIPEEDLHAIEVVLRTRVGAPRLVEAKSLFHTRGCRGCHKVNGVGGDDGPDLSHVGERDPGQTNFAPVGVRSLAAWFKEHFRNPAAVVPGSQMPALGYSEQELDLLTLYMFSLRSSDFPEAFWPKDRIRVTRFGESEFVHDGATLYGTFCAACHGPVGQGMRYAGMPSFPAIGNPAFLELASDRFLAETIRRGRPGRRMPAWGSESGLTESDIIAVIGYVRQLGGGARPSQPDDPIFRIAGDARRGTSLYAQFCAGCHGNKGEGFEGPALANPVLLSAATDRYLFETTRRGRPGTSMEGFSVSTTVRPALSDAEIADVVAFIRTWSVPSRASVAQIGK